MGSNLYLSLLVFSLIAGLVYFFRKDTPPDQSQKVILGVLCVVLMLEFTGNFTARRGINNTLLYNLGWIYLESFMLIGYIYVLNRNPILKKNMIWLAFLCLGWGLLNTLLFQPLNGVFQYFTFLPFSLLIIYLSMRLLLDIINLRIYPEVNLLTLPHFWINSFIIFFYIEALLVFGTYQFFPEIMVNHIRLIFGFNRLMASLMYLAFGLAYFLPIIYKKSKDSIGEVGNV